MFTTVLPVHKGFEIQTYIYVSRDQHGMPAWKGQGYDVSVRIFRAGSEPDMLNSRIFPLPRSLSYDALGEARRAGEKHGRAVIDGSILGQSVSDM
ncbi:hypothetical protein LSG25_02660 [Paralcaligenes sp. KSB-10]|uniref:hypothetical protein n=1 Tax=Paralcaligenes sp. KSB-10 TaxID=2901142 RepID=UPI001E3E3AA4|nr:hypothetical protein [Paralcaligenes sp. KSB-10]UHL64824.1 hypothetical protein LSG25_02660 [Paralcaligenes sp. KSB-10]